MTTKNAKGSTGNITIYNIRPNGCNLGSVLSCAFTNTGCNSKVSTECNLGHNPWELNRWMVKPKRYNPINHESHRFFRWPWQMAPYISLPDVGLSTKLQLRLTGSIKSILQKNVNGQIDGEYKNSVSQNNVIVLAYELCANAGVPLFARSLGALLQDWD